MQKFLKYVLNSNLIPYRPLFLLQLQAVETLPENFRPQNFETSKFKMSPVLRHAHDDDYDEEEEDAIDEIEDEVVQEVATAAAAGPEHNPTPEETGPPSHAPAPATATATAPAPAPRAPASPPYSASDDLFGDTTRTPSFRMPQIPGRTTTSTSTPNNGGFRAPSYVAGLSFSAPGAGERRQDDEPEVEELSDDDDDNQLVIDEEAEPDDSSSDEE